MTVSCQEKHNNGWHPALRRPRQGMKNPNKQDGDTGPPSACREPFHHAADTTHNCHCCFCNNQPALVARHGKRAPSARKRPAPMAARRKNATRRPQPTSNDEDTKRQWCASTEINAHHCKPNPAPTTQRRGAAANTVSRPAGRKWWYLHAPWCSGTQRQCGNHGSCPTTARRKRRPTGNKPASPRRRSRLPW